MRQAAVPFGRPDGFSHTVPIVPSTSGLAALPPTTESNASTCSILKSKKKIENGAVVVEKGTKLDSCTLYCCILKLETTHLYLHSECVR